jgi:hypothetical protein
VSDELPTYSFLAWLRTGVANTIPSPDGDPSVKVRATLPLDVTVTGARLDGSTDSQVVPRNVSLYGPGDIVGIESRAVVKVEPRHWITNFEPNYLPYVEFYEDEFAWRYVPAAADRGSHRLRPWLALLVLKDTEFKDGENLLGKPLPYIELAGGVQAAAVLPAADELWAWAHVHVNADLTNNGDASMPGVIQRFEQTVGANPDRAYVRIMCPRRLEPDVDYHAFVIPTFESGRLAGLGEEIPAATVATASAWDANQATFPYYYRWQFRTGALGDFEYLVGLLKPRPVDKSVGVRDMDVLHPGSNLPKIDLPAELGGILKLGGALRVPFATLPEPDQEEVTKYDHWDEPYPHFFETAMARRINLADDYTRASAETVNPDHDPDPVVTSPLYGRWHALAERVLEKPDQTPLPDNRNWVHRVNLDPRYRVAAGLGTGVVQHNDERYVNAAWQQVGAVIAANNAIRFGQLAQAASLSWHERHIAALADDRGFLVTAPLHARVVAADATVAAEVQASTVPAVLTSAPFRKVVRPGTALTKRLELPASTAGDILTRVNDGEIKPAPPKEPPAGATGIDDAADAIMPSDAPAWVRDLLRRHPWLRFLPLVGLVVAVLLVLLLLGPVVALVAAVVLAPPLIALYLRLRRWQRALALAESIREDRQRPESVDRLPTVPNFVISGPDSGFTPRRGSTDSEEATRFKSALRDAYTFTSVPFPQPTSLPLDLPALAGTVVNAIDPGVTIPRRIKGTVTIPPWILDELVEEFTPVMAYPVLDEPMYKPLADMSSELFLPHINLIPPNSLTLLEANQAFIEAYMLGLNHEMGRELLWREYPTDQRGSYFRQFWDVSLMLPPAPTPADRETLRDIPEIPTWSRHSELGQHNHRATHGQAALLVLVVRGELLKRYPRAVIYAQKSQWHRRPDGSLDADAEREIVELTPAEETTLPPTKIRKPLFEAKVDPDITFIGFALEPEEARGGTTTAEDPGWFFVIKERPGEPRFGLDDVPGAEAPRLVNWNNLAWKHIETAPGEMINLDKTLSFVPYDPAIDQENKPDPEDAQASWRPGTNAAEIAYMLYRVPVLVAVHASRMLPS